MTALPSASRRSARRIVSTGLLVAALGCTLTSLLPDATGRVGPAAALAAESPVQKMIDEAGEKLRLGEAGAAVRLLEQARAKEPQNADAHLLYQEAALDALGEETVVTDYERLARDNPEDALYQFLAVRLMDAEKSLAKWRTLAVKFKDSPWPHAGWARALERLGKFKDALKEHDKALALAPVGDVRFRAFQAYGLERASEWSGAVTSWQQVVQAKPKDRAGLIGLGEALRQSGDIDGAIAKFDLVLQQSPRDVEARYRKALALVAASRYDDAQTEVETLLKAKRGMVEGLCVGAEAALKKAVEASRAKDEIPGKEELAPAVQYAERAVAADKESAYANFVHGAVLEVLGETEPENLDLAIEKYQAALDLIPFPGPEKVRVLVAKSYVSLRLANWAEAVALAKQALEMDDKNLAAYFQAAHALVSLEKSEEAIKDYYKPALKIAPDDARLHHGMGTAYWDLKKHNDAQKLLKRAVQLDEQNGIYRLSLGELYYELQKYKEAVAELFQATELLPKNAEAWSAYGRACTARKHYEEAAEAYEEVIKLLQPKDGEPADEFATECHLYLAILYDRLKEPTKARENAEKFKELGGNDVNLESFIQRLLSSEE